MVAPKARHIPGYGVDWREKRTTPRNKTAKTWVKQIREKHECQPWGDSVEEYTRRLNDLVESLDLEDVYVDTETEYGSYGDSDHERVVVIGWRSATQDEIDKQEQVVAESEARRKEAEERQIEQLKKVRPDLFK